ncbi:sensor histidine kinase [Thermomonospora umbrina]|uniref:histidine kinase n=1 Tax=Thermomonospora umbrina TaxID=111806 RepID=A0A3D9T697_9ACTN|nr:HAMP domain-containing sensor histidine kinase [Thermomonospora umbrina]REF00205.1 two-component system OmpR family sensor kinase [Thermomonospora umbrina]
MALRRPVSLRARLPVMVLALLALGLTVAAGGTLAALLDEQVDRHDRLMASVGRAAQDPQILDLLATDPAAARLWLAGTSGGGLPTFFQLRGPDGLVRRTVSLGASPALPGVLPAALSPRPASAADPEGEIFGRWPLDSGGPPWGDSGWRIRTANLPDGRGVLVTGMWTTESDELAGRVIGVETSVTLGTLGCIGLLALRAVRRGLRPLEEMAVTAAAIGDGDLTRRIGPADPRSEVGRLGAALNAMLGQIESAFRERETSEARLRRFVADASHELRTPVATIRGYAELFRRGAADRPEDLAKAMHRIESEAERMGALVDELLLLARLDQGRPLERSPVDLAELAADAVADARAVEPTRPLTLDTAGPVPVNGDAARLRQLLGNLLANVRGHTPPDTPATVRVTTDGDRAVLEVTDTGPGLPAGQRERVFERFYRADPSRSRDHGGAGLGLSIVAAVAEAHQGRATARPGPAGGASFVVTLPLHTPASPAAHDDVPGVP